MSELTLEQMRDRYARLRAADPLTHKRTVLAGMFEEALREAWERPESSRRRRNAQKQLERYERRVNRRIAESSQQASFNEWSKW